MPSVVFFLELVWLRMPFWLASVNLFLIKEHISKYPYSNAHKPDIIAKPHAIQQSNRLKMILHSHGIQQHSLQLYILCYQTCQPLQECCNLTPEYACFSPHSKTWKKKQKMSLVDIWIWNDSRRCFKLPLISHAVGALRTPGTCQAKCFSVPLC